MRKARVAAFSNSVDGFDVGSVRKNPQGGVVLSST